ALDDGGEDGGAGVAARGLRNLEAELGRVVEPDGAHVFDRRERSEPRFERLRVERGVVLQRHEEPRAAAARPEPLWGVVRDEPAARDDEDTVTGDLHFGEVVRGEDDRPLSTERANE